MPKLTRWAVKLALVHFAGGVVLGALMLAAKAGYGDVGLLSHRLVHIHMLLFGWLVQLTVGVAYWILPKFRSDPRRGTPGLAVASVLALNLGVAAGTAAPWLPVFGAAGWGLETLSILSFAAHAWPRVKPGRN